MDSNSSFAVTWDYLCPFARNAHEHLITGIEGGAPWDVSFRAFSLMQAHVEEGGVPVWEQPDKARGVLALEAGIAVRDRFPDHFLRVHRALFSIRHDQGQDLSDPDVVAKALADAGAPVEEVMAAVGEGWTMDTLRDEHERSVNEHRVFGVPTFIVGDQAVFVRLMSRPDGDGALARSSIDQVVALVTGNTDLNEFKHTTVPR